MKKIGIACMMAILAATGMVSCQESAEKNEQSLAYKIENKEDVEAAVAALRTL